MESTLPQKERRRKSWLRKPLRWKNQPARPTAAVALPSPLFSRACHVQEEAATAEHVSDVRRGTVHAYENRQTRAKRG